MAGGVYDVEVQGFSGATMPKGCESEKVNSRGKAIKGRQEEERKTRSLGGETVIRCRRTAFSLFASAVGQPSLSLILFHIERTSSSDLPILVEITRHENRDFSSRLQGAKFLFVFRGPD